jgi:PAS domain S-box-containing protein
MPKTNPDIQRSVSHDRPDGRRSSSARLLRRSAPTNEAKPSRLFTSRGSPLHDDWERYFDLYNFAPMPYLKLDRNGVIEQINAAGYRALGTNQSLEGRPLVVFVAKEDRTAFLEHIRKCRSQDGVIETDMTLQARDGRRVPVRAYSRRSDVGTVVCWTILIDLTERLHADEARRQAEIDRDRAKWDEQVARISNEAKDRFLAMLSHELRTPLTPALFAAARLLEDDLSEAGRRFARIIKRNIEAEARLISDLLDVTRISRGRLELRVELVDAHKVVQDAIEVCRPHATSKYVAMKENYDATSFHVLADPDRLRQVFWNLLSNAIKFSDGGAVSIDTRNDESGSLRVIVRDAGIGMDSETIGRLFTPFQPQPVASTRGGLGLGLTICRGIVEGHQGRIWATSTGPGQGSTFEVELPTVQAPSESFPSHPQTDLVKSVTPYRILVVEDDADTQTAIATILQHDGHELGVACSLGEAVKLLRERWDLVISDLGLPDGSGLELARHVGTMIVKPRLIALTGFGSDKDRDACRDAGFELHLVKPIDLNELRRVIR